ncbi:jg8821 [Pararge aegeria aegeria]|uniref:Jg8821 protein n=1 Tax=Pararge aegeria aegeria TaxID=348720 RepID=A0A8S4SL86_9NEOP|nr:jg8821 [Pararge aegeria aegeria]
MTSADWRSGQRPCFLSTSPWVRFPQLKNAFLVYTGALFANSGNYKGFGDTKFIPKLSKESFELIIKASKAYERDGTHVTKLWENTKNLVYSVAPRLTSLGLANKGVTTYFSSNCTEEDSNLVNDWMKTKRIEAYICRTFKTIEGDGLPLFTIHLASVEASSKPPLTMGKEKYKNAYFQVTRGDYAPLLSLVNENLNKAIKHAANDNERNMLKHYINSFKEGDLSEHKEGSRFWIKDKGPIIETLVQVGLHELLGHGSGKLLRQNADGTFNFDKEKVKNPLTGKAIESWYSEGETYDSKFTTLGSAFEECRAEAVGLYLSLQPEILKLFGYEGEEAQNVAYVNWLSLLWNGAAKATEMYQPSTETWLQAHARARFVLMRLVELEGNGLLTVTEVEPGKNLLLTLDKTRLATDGKRIIGDFLVKLQTIKATGDVAQGERLFDTYSKLEEPWSRWRDIVMLHKQPRNIFVQPNTVHKGDDVELKSYPASAEGMIAACVERFPSTRVDDILEQLAEADHKYFVDLEQLAD